jgi:hypothetical protein
MIRVVSLTKWLILLSSGTLTLHAQTLPLDKLVSLTKLPATLGPTRQSQADLPTWVFQPTTPLAQQEALTWGWWPEAPAPSSVPPAVLSLRPDRGLYDVVLYLSKPAVFHSLRRELTRKKLAPEVVTCLNCAGERFNTPTYTVALYQNKPQPYPYIVVVHLLDSPSPSKSATTSIH